MKVKRLCSVCGREHTRLMPDPRTRYGPFMDWELYYCTSLAPDEVGCYEKRRLLYFGSEHLKTLCEDPP